MNIARGNDSASGRWLGSVVIALALAAAVVAAPTAAVAESALETLRNQGYATVATGNEPPWTEIRPNGQLTGAGPELVRAVLKRMGIPEMRGELMEYGAMIPALQAGRADMIVTGTLFQNPQRCKAILFSLPDICDSDGFAVKAGNAHDIKSYDDVATTGARIGVPGGSVQEKYARDAGVTNANIVIVPDSQSGIDMLQVGRIDVYALPASSIVSLIDKADDSDLEAVIPVEGIPVACTGVGFRKEDRELRDAYDEAFQAVKASGEFASILSSFGFSEELEAKTTREQLCGGPN